jgi:hypothetical protein
MLTKSTRVKTVFHLDVMLMSVQRRKIKHSAKDLCEEEHSCERGDESAILDSVQRRWCDTILVESVSVTAILQEAPFLWDDEPPAFLLRSFN